VAGRQPQLGKPRRRAEHRRAIRRHRAQAGPEAGARQIAAAREQIADDMRQRLPARFAQRQVVAGELGRAADADAVAEPRHRNLEGEGIEAGHQGVRGGRSRSAG